MYGLLTKNARDLLEIQKKPKREKRIRVSRRLKQRIFWRDSGCCVYCNMALNFDKATLDHVTPLAWRGRQRAKENIVIACFKCNHRKGPLIMDNLDDLSPDALWMKFKQVYDAGQTAKGSYPRWIAAH